MVGAGAACWMSEGMGVGSGWVMLEEEVPWRVDGVGSSTRSWYLISDTIARDFGACIAIPLLYGKDFLTRNPELLDDFWKFDNDAFPLLMIGMPTWTPLKMMKDGVAARLRLLTAMDAPYRRIDQYQSGRPIDFAADMSDISNTALERNRVYVKRGLSFIECGGGDLAILWGQNANTQAIFFWLMLFAYSTKGLVDRPREEVAPYVVLSGEDNPKISSIDLPALFGNCALLKSCIFETYRMANEATSIRYVEQSVTLNDGAYKHELKPGMFVSGPHAVTQRNPAIYKDSRRICTRSFSNVGSRDWQSLCAVWKATPLGFWSCNVQRPTFRHISPRESLYA